MGASLHENGMAAAVPPRVISVFVVTSDQGFAQSLSQLLDHSRHTIRVEWVSSRRARLNNLVESLSRNPVRMPSIVMLDFRALGTAIWHLITRCTARLPDNTVEWFVVNHQGSCPRLNDTLWRRITLLEEAPARN